jgi:hypothetical protein
MIATSINKLEHICETVPSLLQNISETDFSFKSQPEKWSKKEILGHLIDSATNNHHRFVRAQFENIPTLTYNQIYWNEFSFYQQIKKGQLIQFWTSYNLQLLSLMKLIPSSNLKKECNTGETSNVTIECVFSDYVSHLENHLDQILGYCINLIE